MFFNIGVEVGQLIFVFAVLAIMAVLRYGARMTRDSALYRHGQLASVYLIGVMASYWLIERSLSIFQTG